MSDANSTFATIHEKVLYKGDIASGIAMPVQAFKLFADWLAEKPGVEIRHDRTPTSRAWPIQIDTLLKERSSDHITAAMRAATISFDPEEADKLIAAASALDVAGGRFSLYDRIRLAAELPPEAERSAEEFSAAIGKLMRDAEAVGVAGAAELISTPAGWFSCVTKAAQGLIDLAREHPYAKIRIRQIKEKFGELRFYTHAGSDENHPAYDDEKFSDLCIRVMAISDWAEAASSGRCMLTGHPAQRSSDGGWISTLSAEAQKLKKEDPDGFRCKLWPFSRDVAGQ